MAQEYILVEAGHKEEVAAALLPSAASRTQEEKSWCDERVNLVLSHCLITYDLFLSRDCQIYSELGEPVTLGHLQL